LNTGAEPIIFEYNPPSFFAFLKEKDFEVYNTALGLKPEMAILNFTRKPACLFSLELNAA
jgi:hypothetical protein